MFSSNGTIPSTDLISDCFFLLPMTETAFSGTFLSKGVKEVLLGVGFGLLEFSGVLMAVGVNLAG